MSAATGPYRVERVDSPQGPGWRLAGPGLEGGKAYPWEEVREKLREMAELMNFAWRQATNAGDSTSASSPPDSGAPA